MPLRLFIALFLAGSLHSHSQSLFDYRKAGERAYRLGNYHEALAYFEVVYEGQPKSKNETMYMLGISAIKARATTKGIAFLENCKKRGYEGRKPEINYHLAVAYRQLGEYAKSIPLLERFCKSQKKSPLTNDAKAMLALSIQMTKSKADFTDNHYILTHLGDSINTPFSDFAPAFYQGHFFFSSLKDRNATKRKKGEHEDMDLQSRVYLMGNGLPRAVLGKKDFHYSGFSLDTNSNQAFLTAYKLDGKGKKSYFIHTGKFDGQKISKIQNLVGIPAFTNSMQPFFHEENGEKAIYFASDKGSKYYRIWKARVENGQVGEAVPFWSDSAHSLVSPHIFKGKMYYSAEKPSGYGGYDIYEVELATGKERILPFPINSPRDDLYYFQYVDNKGFIASNRAGTQSLDEESCCLDIFRFEYKPVEKELAPNLAPQVPKTDSLPLVQMEYKPVEKDSIPTNPTHSTSKTDSLQPVHTIGMNDSPSALPIKPIEANKNKNKINQFLPIHLYFRNDEPDSNTMRTLTRKTYSETYFDYIDHKNEYIKGSDSMIGPQLEDFFTQKVETSYQVFRDSFITMLHETLASGDSATIVIRGYTSPRASNAYNMALAQRRVSSITNELVAYRQSVLMPYLLSGKLRVETLFLGENTAPTYVSDKINDPKNSVYDHNACEERRVSIELVR